MESIHNKIQALRNQSGKLNNDYSLEFNPHFKVLHYVEYLEEMVLSYESVIKRKIDE